MAEVKTASFKKLAELLDGTLTQEELRRFLGIEPSRHTFKYEATEVETARILAFREEHVETCGDSTATIGEQWKYTMVPTSLGSIVKITCLLCHQERDCTEYEAW